MRHDDLDYKKQQSNCQDMKWKERRWKDQKREEMEKKCLFGDPENPARQERQNFNFPDLNYSSKSILGLWLQYSL